MFMLALASLAAAPVVQDVHDPRKAPTRVEHALIRLPAGVVDVAPLGDVDGDRLDELVVRNGRSLDVHRGGTGERLRRLARLSETVSLGLPTWAVGADVDDDGIADVALIADHEGRSHVQLVSGRSGILLRRWAGSLIANPRSVDWCGDVDGDELVDVVAAYDRGPEVHALPTRGGETDVRKWARVIGWQRIFEETLEAPNARVQCVGDRNGDGVLDVLLDEGRRARGTSIWLSGTDGAVLDDALGQGGSFIPVGDLDGDGLGDVIEEVGESGGFTYGDFVLHASSGEHAWSGSRYPDLLPDYPWIAAIGDIDSDGVPDVAVGDTNFHLRDTRQRDLAGGHVHDLSKLPLQKAIGIESEPMSVAQESGCVWVLSGRTGEKLMAVFGEPGTHHGIGMRVASVGDQTGDGVPDLGVAALDGYHVFATVAVPLPSADPFDWLPGRWLRTIELDGAVRVHEEVWLEPAAGRMLGTSRTYVRGADSGGSFEFLRIEREEDAYALFAQPGGEPAVRFESTELGAGRVLFTNPEHDFPTRILYRRRGTELTALVGTAAEPDALRFVWRLQKGD